MADFIIYNKILYQQPQNRIIFSTQMLNPMLRYILFLLFTSGFMPCYAQYFDTLHIHYDIGVAGLQKKDKAVLDSLTKHSGTRKMLIYSYADYLGSEKPNQHLSDNRALEVKTYLLRQGIPPEQIMECTGLGRIEGSGGTEGDITYRRTDIFIKRAYTTKVNQHPSTAKKESKTKEIRPKEIPETEPVPASGEKATPRTEGIPVGDDGGEESTPKVTVIEVDTLQVNQTLNLRYLFFHPGRSDIYTSSYPELRNLYKVMLDHPALKIKLEGHVCCCVYPDGYFKDTPTWGLSVDRAFVIYKYLVDQGIAPARMQYEGFGRTRPIREDEKTVEEGLVNRRVEIRILEK